MKFTGVLVSLELAKNINIGFYLHIDIYKKILFKSWFNDL